MKFFRYIAVAMLFAGYALAASNVPSYMDGTYPTRAALSTMTKALALNPSYKHMCITETGYAGCYDAIADSTATINGVTVLTFSDAPATGRWVRNSLALNAPAIKGTVVLTPPGITPQATVRPDFSLEVQNDTAGAYHAAISLINFYQLGTGPSCAMQGYFSGTTMAITGYGGCTIHTTLTVTGAGIPAGMVIKSGLGGDNFLMSKSLTLGSLGLPVTINLRTTYPQEAAIGAWGVNSAGYVTQMSNFGQSTWAECDNSDNGGVSVTALAANTNVTGGSTVEIAPVRVFGNGDVGVGYTSGGNCYPFVPRVDAGVPATFVNYNLSSRGHGVFGLEASPLQSDGSTRFPQLVATAGAGYSTISAINRYSSSLDGALAFTTGGWSNTPDWTIGQSASFTGNTNLTVYDPATNRQIMTFNKTNDAIGFFNSNPTVAIEFGAAVLFDKVASGRIATFGQGTATEEASIALNGGTNSGVGWGIRALRAGSLSFIMGDASLVGSGTAGDTAFTSSATRGMWFSGNGSTSPALGIDGSNNLRFGTYTGSVCVNAGYVTINDIGGTPRKIMICS